MAKEYTSPSDRELLITRMVNAPRDLVFEVWTKPEHVVHWYGPRGFTITIEEMDVRKGGVWKFIMHGPDGTDYPSLMKFRDVIKPERLEFLYGTGEEDDPAEFYMTVDFVDKGKQTEVTMRLVFKTADQLRKNIEIYGAIEGNRQTFEKLEAYLKTL